MRLARGLRLHEAGSPPKLPGNCQRCTARSSRFTIRVFKTCPSPQPRVTAASDSPPGSAFHHRLGGGSNSMMLGDRVYMEYSTTCRTSEVSVCQQRSRSPRKQRPAPPTHSSSAPPGRACLCTSCNASRPSFMAACIADPSCVPRRGSGHAVVRCQCSLPQCQAYAVFALRDSPLTLSCLWSLNPSNTRRRTYLGAQASTHDACQSQCTTPQPRRRGGMTRRRVTHSRML